MSILESKYEPPARPYSQKELKYLRNRNLNNLRVGYYMVEHSDCGHYYFAKKFGKKEKELIEDPDNRDVGNCSVCWKIKQTPKHLKTIAVDMVDTYCNVFYDVQRLQFSDLDLEKCFYTWLYKEQF
jgi:hypothetical protein